jgi:hypothetical protein
MPMRDSRPAFPPNACVETVALGCPVERSSTVSLNIGKQLATR